MLLQVTGFLKGISRIICPLYARIGSPQIQDVCFIPTIHRTVSLSAKLFEVDPTLVGERVTLRFNPAKPDARIQIVHNGTFIEIARQVDLYANCFEKPGRRE